MSADVLLSLVEQIYATADDPARWQDFSDELSEVLGDSAVILALRLPGYLAPVQSFQTHIGPEFASEIRRNYPHRIPRLPGRDPTILNGFTFLRDMLSDETLVRSEFFRSWMEPQGLAAEVPLAHSFASDANTPLAEIGIFRRQGSRPITEADHNLCNLLAPHLASAFRLYRRLGGEQHEQLALAEVVNRLDLGVILVDRERQPVVTNRSADRIIAAGDAFTIGEDGLHAQNLRDDAVMQKMLGEAIAGGRGGTYASSPLAVSRSSGRRALPVVVSSLLEAGIGDAAENAVASLVIGNPETGPDITPEVFQIRYELTPAESELVGLLVAGKSLKDAARLRGVTLSTVRSQLKRVFIKTNTKRQTQLIRLLLTGAAEPAEPDDAGK